MPAQIAALSKARQPVWVFAYGSLIWDPEFLDAEGEPALLRGYHRSFCIYSRDYRGTFARPGLVLGLDRGGSCRGLAFRLPPTAVRTGRGALEALAFTVLRDSPDYAGRLPLDQAATLILDAVGRRGACRDYFEQTLRHLEQRGLTDRRLRRLAEHIAELAERKHSYGCHQNDGG